MTAVRCVPDKLCEAHLIIAEAEGGQSAVNNPAVHRTAGPFGTDYIRNQIVEERRRELFLESHHLGDQRRYKLPLRRAAGTEYPWSGGGFYGDAVCFPAPFSETTSNPNFR